MATRIIALLVFTLALTSYLADQNAAEPAKPTEWQGSFFFIQLADTQFGFGNYEQNVQNFKDAATYINKHKPEFVVVCGDLVSDPFKEEEKNIFLEISKTITVPVYVVAGNHDVGNTPSAKTMAWYRKNFGKDWYSFDHKGCAGVVLNSSLIKSPGDQPEEAKKQRAWVESEFEKLSNKGYSHIFVFTHHPFFLKKFDEADQYFNIQTPHRVGYFAMFEKYGVRAVFSGHYHKNSYGKHKEIEMITTSAIGRPLGKDPSGFRIVEVFKDSIEHTYFGLKDAPVKIDVKKGP